MSTKCTFHSRLASAMSQFVAFKRMQGYDYTSQAVALQGFDRLLSVSDCSDGVLQSDTFERYVAATAELAPGTRAVRLAVVRQFSRYLHAHRPESAVVPLGMLPRHSRQIRFFQITENQVSELMNAATRLRPKNSIRPHSIRFLIGILYSTGLRISEALKLDLRDVDLKRSTLLVRMGKFGKDRLAPVSPSTREALNTWLELRSHYAETGALTPLFLGAWNRRLTYGQASYGFRRLCLRCGLLGKPSPRLHDLRHNYACRRITLWREAGQDIEALLPILAHAMGHANIFNTQLYIHIDAQTFLQASEKFNSHVTQQMENPI